MTLPVSEADSGRKGRDRGWQLAHWAVANASSLRIERVSYAGEEWAAGNGGARWNPIDDEDGKNPAGSGGDTDAVRITTA